MASSRKRTTSPASSPATGSGKKMKHSIQEEQLPSSQPSEICTYWPANPAFVPKRVPLKRMFFINEDRRSTCLSVSILHVIINLCWNSEPFGGEDPSPSFLPTEKSQRCPNVCLRYVTQCVSVGTGSSIARLATFGYTLRKVTARPDCLSARNK